jgi:RNA polymerase sigma-70 factor (ECF subfamily)
MYSEAYSYSDQLVFTPATLTDEALVVSAQSGCHVAYAELFRRHREIVFRTVQRITKNQDDTEDVLQEAWLNAFVHIKAFDQRSRFSTWLIRIAINSALMMLRKRRRFNYLSLDQSMEPGLPFIPEPASLAHSPEEVLIRAERQLLVRQAVRRLPIGLRGITEIRQKQDGSIHEVALTAGISVSATKSRLRRARLVLRDKLEMLEGCHANQSAR